jgi:isoquinoline 1-oxidoreductase subunit beta
MKHNGISRRTFVVTAASAAGGMMLGFYRPAAAATLNPRPWLSPAREGGADVNIWLAIDRNGVVTVRTVSEEMGQGILTTQAMMLAEELSVDWANIRVVHADVNHQVMTGVYTASAGKDQPRKWSPPWRIMRTGGSTSVMVTRELYQQAGASARERLKEAAAQAWGVSRADVNAEFGVLSSGEHKGTYGEFAERAAEIQLTKEPAIKRPDQFTLMGTSVTRIDTPAKVNGSAAYGIDTRLPGMVYAAVQVSPVPGGRLRSYDFNAIKDRPGVIRVVELVPDPSKVVPDNPYKWSPHSALKSGIAVVADSWYRAKTALELMPKEWDDGPDAGADTESMFAERRALLDQPGTAHDSNVGDARAILAASSRVVTADFERPYEAHACMEPMNCTIGIGEDGRVDVYVGSQRPSDALLVTADQMGIDPSKVFVHPAFLGGGFGRRAKSDEVRQAAEIARQVGRSVKLVWTREEDIGQNQMRSMAVARLSAALAPDGFPKAIVTRSVAETVYAKNLAGALAGQYGIPNQHHEYHTFKSHIPTTFLRGVGNSLFDFMNEQFVDEMALAGGHDPLEFRLKLLEGNSRMHAVLRSLKEKSGFRTDLPKGMGMGIAISQNHNTPCAQCATVKVNRSGELRVEKIDIVFDSGNVVNRSICVQQLEGCAVYELSHALYGGIDIRNGRVENNNFDRYRILRIDQMPEINVYFALSGGETWGSVSEEANGQVAPAVANAIFFATGKRVRSTPILKHDLSWA